MPGKAYALVYSLHTKYLGKSSEAPLMWNAGLRFV